MSFTTLFPLEFPYFIKVFRTYLFINFLLQYLNSSNKLSHLYFKCISFGCFYQLIKKKDKHFISACFSPPFSLVSPRVSQRTDRNCLVEKVSL